MTTDKPYVYFQKAKELFTRTYGDHHPELAVAYQEQGDILIKLGQYSSAYQSYRLAIQANIWQIALN